MEYEFVKLVRELRRIRRPPPFPEIARDVVGLFNLSTPDFWLEYVDVDVEEAKER